MPSTHQLAAIMFTDIAGYTALMGDDEERAYELLEENRHLQKPLIEKFKGRLIKELGDGILASFSGVSDAVNCASQIIKGCETISGLQLRIGIHLAEVVFDNNDVFGDGVNIASRLQSSAPIGAIWISEDVYRNISNKKGMETKFIGKQNLKHVKDPVPVYEIINNSFEDIGISLKNNERKETKIPNEKTIAVLPFINMSSDPEQEFFSDGLTEEIITDLSRLETLLVISRSSIMTFKGTHKKIKEIAEEVNSRYILEGSVRKSGNNLRITAQLIDAFNDRHLWAEKYSGTVDDVFDIQERVSRSIVKALDLKLTRKEESFLSEHPIQNVKAHECYIRARQEIWKFTESGLDNAVVLAQRGLDLIGDNAILYAILSQAYLFIQHYGIRNDHFYLEKAHEYASKSLELDPDCPQAKFVQGILAFKKGNLQEAARIFRKLLNEDQNNADALHFLIVCYCMAGRTDVAVPIMERLFQVDPLTTNVLAFPGVIEMYGGHIKESLPLFRNWYQMDSKAPFTRFWYSIALALNNNVEECFEILDLMIDESPALIYGKFAMFFKSALSGDKKSADRFDTAELKRIAETLDYLPMFMAYANALINKKEEAVNWLNKSLDFGYAPYPFVSKLKTFHNVLKDEKGFQEYLNKVKKRAEEFVVD